jgi:hypothetical protein
MIIRHTGIVCGFLRLYTQDIVFYAMENFRSVESRPIVRQIIASEGKLDASETLIDDPAASAADAIATHPECDQELVIGNRK